MTNLKETSELVLKTIYADNRIITKKYTELDALKELRATVQFLIDNIEEEEDFDPFDSLEVGMTDSDTGIF